MYVEADFLISQNNYQPAFRFSSFQLCDVYCQCGHVMSCHCAMCVAKYAHTEYLFKQPFVVSSMKKQVLTYHTTYSCASFYDLSFTPQYQWSFSLSTDYILYVVFFLLGYSPAFEWDAATFRNTVSSIFAGGVSPAYTTCEDGTACSIMSARKIHPPGNHPKESTQHSEHGESSKSGRHDIANRGISRLYKPD